MNNVVKLQRRTEYRAVTATQVLAALLGCATLLIELAVYFIEYSVYAIKLFLKTDTAKGIAVFYRRYVRIWIYSTITCAVLANFGSARLGLTCVSLCVPTCIVYTLLSKLPRAE